MYKSTIKTLIDFIASLIGLLILSPLLIVVAVLLTHQNNGTPFFFKQDLAKIKKLFKSSSLNL
jgi:lipopolysaccharide/colanic/teichoic acid biosynthesis glycosyltransferase